MRSFYGLFLDQVVEALIFMVSLEWLGWQGTKSPQLCKTGSLRSSVGVFLGSRA
ncbi:hypothetical protein CCP2SC5_840005 [Azospirillaceae bacterium]